MYTTVKDLNGAIEAAARLAERRALASPAGAQGAEGSVLAQRLPLLVDQVMAESGIVEPAVSARAIDQAGGDISRAVSLVRAWAVCLPRLGRTRAELRELEATRRSTPALQQPVGGQYLGASRDYLQRLLDLDHGDRATTPGSDRDTETEGSVPDTMPSFFVRAAEHFEEEGVIAPPEPAAIPLDRTRTAAAPGAGRGAFLQALARAETGAMTAVAYTGVRGDGSGADPSLIELRAGTLPVRVVHPATGRSFAVGRIRLTAAETVLYRVSPGDSDGAVTDGRFTLGVGVTVGELERRAIAASFLDARVARAADDPPGSPRLPADDEEWLLVALDGGEATGFVEHLKLPHHVTFSSDLDRVRALAAGADPTLPLPDEDHQ